MISSLCQTLGVNPPRMRGVAKKVTQPEVERCTHAEFYAMRLWLRKQMRLGTTPVDTLETYDELISLSEADRHAIAHDIHEAELALDCHLTFEELNEDETNPRD